MVIDSVHEYPDRIILGIPGGFMLVTQKDDIETIHEIIDDGKRFCETYDDLMNYMTFCLEELGWIK